MEARPNPRPQDIYHRDPPQWTRADFAEWIAGEVENAELRERYRRQSEAAKEEWR